MAFVEHSVKQPMHSHFRAELELSNKSFIASSSSTLEKQKDTNAQGLFVTRALDGLSKSSIANDSTMRVASGSAIPHWMSSNQVQNIPVDASPKSGSTRNMVETLGAISAFPSPNLGFYSEGHPNSSIVIDLTDWLVNSKHLSLQQVPARPPRSVCVVPTSSLKRDGGQKEEPKIPKEDALSFLLHKQEKQPAKEHLLDLPILSLGLSSGQLSHERAEASSWVSKFPFQIASSSGQAEHGRLTNSRGGEHLTEGACREVASMASQFMGSKGPIDHTQFMGSKGRIDHTQFLLEQSQSTTEVVPSQKTGLANTSLNSAWPLPATISGANAPSLKRDRDSTLIQSVSRHPQLLPEFFAQRKVMVDTEANRPHFAKSEGLEKISKVAFSQKSLSSRVSGENAGFNLASQRGTIHSDKSRNPLTDHKSIAQQDLKNRGEALKTRTLSSLQSLHDSSRSEELLKVSLETLTEYSKTVKGAKFASMKPVEKYDKFASSEGRVIIEAVPLSSAPAADQATSQPLSITSSIGRMVGASRPAELMLFRDGASAELSTIISLSLLKHSSDFKGSEEGNFSAHKYAQRDEEWGDFLAAPPSFGQNEEIEGKLMLPFQQRFEQLQKFLKKCDGSDDEYCLRASCSLSKNSRSNRSAELESRALRLSVEEGKEMKRAKLLNVLEELPEAFMDTRAKLMAPSFSAYRALAVVKEEA